MNIDDRFNVAEVYLDMAHDKVNRLDFAGSLVPLVTAYSHILSLIEQVHHMMVQPAETEPPAEGHTE